MGQDKKRLNQLLEYVKWLYGNPDNKEFAAGIQSIVLNDFQVGDKKETWTKQINDIYELCLKRNLQEQAEDLFKDFPLVSIAGNLVELFVDMENARRANDFNAFGFFLYQQIEIIVNTLISETRLSDIYNGFRLLPPFYITDKKTGNRVRVIDNENRYKTVEEFVLIPKKKKDGTLYYPSIGKPLNEITAIEKARAVVYLVINNGEIFKSYNSIRDDFFTLSLISNVRNHEAHSGGYITDYQNSQYEQLIEDRTKNYLRFLAYLLSFIKGTADNYPLSDKLFVVAGLK